MSTKHENARQFKRLLPWGAQREIARQLGVNKSAVSQALDTLNPRSPAVQAAVRMIRKNDVSETEKALAELLNAASGSSEGLPTGSAAPLAAS